MSEIRATTISDSAGTGPITLTKQHAPKVWINFNGTGTIATRTSFAVSSITDNGTGDYTVSFSNSFDDEPCAHMTGGATAAHYNNSSQTSSYRINHISSSGSSVDTSIVTQTVSGDLA